MALLYYNRLITLSGAITIDLATIFYEQSKQAFEKFIMEDSLSRIKLRVSMVFRSVKMQTILPSNQFLDACDTCVRLSIALDDKIVASEDRELLPEAQRTHASVARTQRVALKEALHVVSVSLLIPPHRLRVNTCL